MTLNVLPKPKVDLLQASVYPRGIFPKRNMISC